MSRLKDEFRSFFADSTLDRMLRDNGWLFGSNAVGLVMSFASGVLVARMLGVVRFGTVAIVVSFVAIINALTSFRMREFIVRYISGAVARGDKDEAGAIAKVSLLGEAVMSCVAFAVAYLLAPWATSAFLPNGTGADLMRVYALVILANLVSESTKGVLQAFGDFRTMAGVAVGEQVVRLGGVIVLTIVGGDSRAVLGVYVLAQAFSCAALAWRARRHLSQQLGRWWRVRIAILRPQMRSMAGFALNTNLGATLSLVAKRVDMLFLGAFVGSAEAGYFSLGQSLVGISFLPVASLTDPYYPVLSREVDNGRTSEVRRLIERGSRVTLYWVVPSGMLALSTIWFLVPLVYGSDFGPAALAFALMWPGAAFAQVLFWARPTLLALGRPGYGNIVTASLCVAKIGLLFLLVPPFGYVASAALLSAFAIASSGLMAKKAVQLLGDRSDRERDDKVRRDAGTPMTPGPASTVGLP